ncbi:GapA-binding peptide SR1P [Aquibacillus saliphilus]|uniref:GapA-binding peptide SR1P n=1 Tax=Aquibacillus saliphilus TaxID=1909422 RepID=UPI001CF0A573|nr:GapA-binding peptide SR1P [Aquibacillus saliphilus]
MSKFESLPNMGVILCAKCESEIDTIASAKVMTYYANCDQCDCGSNQQDVPGEVEKWN